MTHNIQNYDHAHQATFSFNPRQEDLKHFEPAIKTTEQIENKNNVKDEPKQAVDSDKVESQKPVTKKKKDKDATGKADAKKVGEASTHDSEKLDKVAEEPKPAEKADEVEKKQ